MVPFCQKSAQCDLPHPAPPHNTWATCREKTSSVLGVLHSSRTAPLGSSGAPTREQLGKPLPALPGTLEDQSH